MTDFKVISVRLSKKSDIELTKLSEWYFETKAQVIRRLIEDRAKKEGLKHAGIKTLDEST